MRRIFACLIVVSIFYSSTAISQNIDNDADLNNAVTTPYRPKLAEFSYNRLYEYNTYCTSNEFGNSSSEVHNDTQFKFRLGVPVLMKKSTLLGVQLKFDKHNFVVDFNDDYELYNHIEKRNFTSMGARLIYQKSFDENKKLTLVAGAEIKSDEITVTTNTSKYYAHIGYDKRLSSGDKLGGGLMVAYTLGRPQIYPLISYERGMGRRWTLDLDLPKKAAIRYKASERFYVTGITEVKGWRYAVHNFDLSPESELTLRKSDLNIGVSLEHELHDWLWVGMDMGMSKNLRYFLSKPGDGYRDALIDLRADDTPYFKFGIYIVPPKKIYLKDRN